MHDPRRWTALLPAILLCASAGCGGGGSTSDAAAAAAAPAGADAAPAATALARWQRPAGLDVAAELAELPEARIRPEVEPLLRAWAESCQTVKPGDQMYSCDSAAGKALEDWAREAKPPELYETLAEIALAHEDPVMRLAAVDRMDSLRSTVGHPFVYETATRAAAARALRVLEASRESPALTSHAARVAISLGPPAGMADVTFAVVDEHPIATARSAAFPEAMKYGRDAGFRYLVHAGERHPADLRSALMAPRQMWDETGVDKAAVCDWAEGYIGHEDDYVASEAGKTLLWYCGPETVPTLLAEGERRLAAGTLGREMARLYREPCFNVFGVVDEGARRCGEVFAFLEKVGNTEGLDPAIRGEALWNIYYQRRDSRTLALLRTYEEHPDETVRAKVAEAIRSLEQAGVEG